MNNSTLSTLIDWVHSRATDDEADTVLVTVVMMFPLLILLMGWSVDFSKNAMIRGDYEDIAQSAVQTAIRYQDGVGNVNCVNTSWLDWPQAVAFVNANVGGDGAGSAQAVATYMMKTGRADAHTFSSSASAKYVYDADSDYVTVSSFRSFAQTMKASSRYASTHGDSTNSTDGNYFAIKVTCSNTDSSGGYNRGAGDYDRVALQIRDWTSNMFMTLPTDNNGNVTTGRLGVNTTPVQKFNISKQAISSYSASSLNVG